ncbi:MAG: hypothetical protein MR239_06805 [Clostridiales bacterium]|nr:hypothetical protein [Clostridiales bacterium]
MKTIFTKQKLFFIFAALVAFVFFFGLTTGANTYAADNAVSSFDDTDVVEDLKAAGLTLENYPKKSDGKVQVIYFVEYGYNIRANEQANYGLYLYVYNPAEVNINVDGKNFVQISSKRNADGKPTDYSKYFVKCVSKSSGVYGKLFYKFKVVAGLSEQLAYVNDDVRRYDVSGIELQTAGEANATEYPISTTFYYSGYAKGFGKDKTAESTLSCRSEELETIGLEVKHTTYKYQNAKNGGQEIASVYFNVPNEYFTDYGGLQKIKAEWLKAITKDILVTNNQLFYDYLKPWIGKTTGSGSLEMKYYLYDADSKYTGNKFPASSNPNIYYSEFYMPWAYNVITFGTSPDFGGGTFGEYVNTFWWLFNGGTGDVKDITVSSDTILDYYGTFVNKSDLLLSVDEEKTVKEIDADDAFKIEGFDKNANLVNWLTKLLYPDIETSTLTGISPIQVLSSDDVKGTDEEVAKKLYVDKNDVKGIKSSVNRSGSKTVLFRFAVSDYVNKEVVVCNRETGNNLGTNLVYRNRLPMYLDFDIIWLGFQKNGKLTIIPAVSSPTNIIGGTQPPVKDVIDKAQDWLKDLWNNLQRTKDKILNVLKWVGIALGSILVVLLLYIVIKAIVKACTAVSKKRQNNRYTKK